MALFQNQYLAQFQLHHIWDRLYKPKCYLMSSFLTSVCWQICIMPIFIDFHVKCPINNKKKFHFILWNFHMVWGGGQKSGSSKKRFKCPQFTRMAKNLHAFCVHLFPCVWLPRTQFPSWKELHFWWWPNTGCYRTSNSTC